MSFSGRIEIWFSPFLLAGVVNVFASPTEGFVKVRPAPPLKLTVLTVCSRAQVI